MIDMSSRIEVDNRVIAVGWDDADIPADASSEIVSTLCGVAPRLEVTRPNLCTIPARGPSRFYGSEMNACQKFRNAAHNAARIALRDVLRDAVSECLRVKVGIADTRFAAELAANRDLLVPPGRTREFLAELPVSALEHFNHQLPTIGKSSRFSVAAEVGELCRLLHGLGLHTLGAFAALPADAVAIRFGAVGTLTHRIAKGEQPTPLTLHQLPDPPTASIELDPPAERVDVATFAARSLAAKLMTHLNERGLACSRLRIDAETEHGEHLSRLWRAVTVFDADTIIERLRWQLTGWLDSRSSEAHPTAGITLLRLHADEVVKLSDLQLGLWGEMSANDRRAARGLDRVRGLLGPNSVHTTMITGGRGPAQRVQLLPWGEPHPSSASTIGRNVTAPWPGHVPAPAPAIVHSVPVPANCCGTDGRPVVINGRGSLSAPLARIQIGDEPWNDIESWAGPWLSDEFWWDQTNRRRVARFQVLTVDHAAHLCVIDQGQWWIEATYD